MKTLITAAIRCSLMLLLPTNGYAISAQWDLDPISGDWNTADNWTPVGVPNGPADIATFALSNTTHVSISMDTEVNGIVFTPAATNPYTITAGSSGCCTALSLTLSGAGIINNSGITQTFSVGALEVGGQMRFMNSASASNASIILVDDGSIDFFNLSTASSANILGSGNQTHLNYFDNSTAASAVIDYSRGGRGLLNFSGNSTAANATVTTDNDAIGFSDHSSAGNATITGPLGFFDSIQFFDDSSADNATIIEGFFGVVEFFDSSTAGRANIQGNGTQIAFSGSSEGGTAAIGLFVNQSVPSSLEISGHNAPGVTIGSLEGDETATVFLGANNLAVGNNNLSTIFSGVIQDGGSFTKIGTGTLTLANANTYTGGTTIEGGRLVVNNMSGSGTGSGPVQVNAGTLSGRGTIAGAVTVGTGNGAGAVLSPGRRGGKPGNSLTILSTLTFNSDATYDFGLSTKKAIADKVVANTVTVTDAHFRFHSVGQGLLTPGTVFTVIDNTAAIPIAGTFSNLPDGSTFTVGNNTFQANYEGGTGNDLTLTVQ